MSPDAVVSNYEPIVVDGPGGQRRIRLVPPRSKPDPALLDDVRAASELSGAQRRASLRQTIPNAYRGGWRVTDLTKAGQVSRQTVYTILNEASAR